MDALRLPPVPPPAPDTHPWRDRIVIALVFVLLAVMATVDPLNGAAIRWEKRRASTWPPLSRLKSPTKYSAAFTDAFADHFGMRSALILLEHWTMVDLFGVSPVYNVMLGRDGWLIWLGEDGQSLDKHYRGTRMVPDSEADAYVAEVKRRHDYFQSRGIAYLTVIVPEKFTIYPEYLPAWVAPGPKPSLLARTMDRMAQDGTVPYVDLRPLLRGAKGTAGPEPLYYLTDTHWNLAGAGIGYMAIMRKVQELLPGRIPEIAPPIRPPYVAGQDFFWGDLARVMGIPFRFKEPDYLPLWKVKRDAAQLGLHARLVTPDNDAFKIYAQPNTTLPRMLMNRDSMAIALMPMLSENFSWTVFVLSSAIQPKRIDDEYPDIVIDEIVERGMVRIAHQPIKP